MDRTALLEEVTDEEAPGWQLSSPNHSIKYIIVVREIIRQALDFLSKVQAKDGSFPEVGHVSHKDIKGGSSKELALTAYTLIFSLEKRALADTYRATIDKALSYVISNFNGLEDNYSLAIATYALHLAYHTSKDSLLTKLNSQTRRKQERHEALGEGRA